MTREEAIQILSTRDAHGVLCGYTSGVTEALDMAIEALSAEPKTEMVLCALADRACPFQGQEYAWCLTCPHISEEDRELVKKAVGRPTGWIPVTERLPKEHGAYLVTFPMMLKDKMSVTILLYGKPLMPNTEIKKVCWYDSDSEYGDIVYDDVVAWMPMPKPYKGGDEG